MNKKKDRGMIEELTQLNIEEAKEKLKRLKEDWSKWKEEGAQEREQYLRDLYLKQLEEEELSNKQHMKKFKRNAKRTKWKFLL